MRMAVKFAKTFIISTITALVAGAFFYVTSLRIGAVSAAYTLIDTQLGSVFVFLLALIIGLSLWPRLLEKKVQKIA